MTDLRYARRSTQPSLPLPPAPASYLASWSVFLDISKGAAGCKEGPTRVGTSPEAELSSLDVMTSAYIREHQRVDSVFASEERELRYVNLHSSHLSPTMKLIATIRSY